MEKLANPFAKQKNAHECSGHFRIAFLSMLLASNSTSLWFRNVERLIEELLPIFEHLLQPGALIRLEDRIHSVLPTGEDSIRLTQIERTQIRELIFHLPQDWPHFLRLFRLETQIPLESIRRKSKRLAFFGATYSLFYRAAREKAAGHRTRNKDCNQNQNNFPSS